MQIVIDIPEEEYAAICYNVLNEREHSYGYVAIANGKPLPKGHGRLIDGDKALRRGGYDESYIRLNTIIEANKEVDE